jgi:radical SAM protein with 4Fe4S-binding SPASM domain
MLSNPQLRRLNRGFKKIEDKVMPPVCRTRPIHMFVDVTSRCNIDCVMCWRQFAFHNAFGDMPLETFKKLLPLMDYCESVVLQGSGEPFVNPHFLEMLKLAGEHTDGIRFATNGTIMPERYAEALVENRVRTMMVSLDAGSKETYEKIRRKSNWDHVMGNIERLINTREKRNATFPEVTLEFVLMRSNIMELENYIKVAQRFGIKYVGVRHIWIFGEATRKESMFMYPDLMKDEFEKAARLGQELGIMVDLPPQSEIKIAEDYVVKELNDPILNKLSESIFVNPGPGKVCHEPWRNYWVNWNGDIHPCCHTIRKMGNVNEESFSQIWNGMAYQLFRENIRSGHYPKECIGCRNLQNFDGK